MFGLTTDVSDRKRRAVVSCSALVSCLALASLAAPAHAEQAFDPKDRDRARSLGLEGADAFVAEDYGAALDRFQRARRLFNAPTLAVMEARALAKLGRWLEALEVYAATERSRLESNAPATFRRAVRDAEREAVALRERVPALEIRASTEIVGLEITLDGSLRSHDAGAIALDIDPGIHVIRASAAGFIPFEREVSVEPGARPVVLIEMTAVPKPTPHSVAPQRVTRTVLPAASQDARPLVGWVALGGGGAVIAASGVLYTIAWNEKRALERVCTSGCPASATSDIEAFRLHRTAAFVGFGVGLAAAGAGSYLLWGTERSEAHVAASLASDRVIVSGAF